MKKKQQAERKQSKIRTPTIGTAITTPRFVFDELEDVVARERLEGRRDWVKILVGSILNFLPVTVLKWQL